MSGAADDADPHRRRWSVVVSGWLKGLADWLFGYDYFISYGHADGANYPRQLLNRLQKSGFRAFLDAAVYVAGDELRMATQRRVRMSSYLVLIARRHALKSRWVLRELEVYIKKGRTPIVVNINGALEEAETDPEIFGLLADRIYISEAVVDDDGEPSDAVLEAVRRSFESTRQETRRLRFLGAAAVVFAGLTVAAGVSAMVAFRESSIAEQRRLSSEQRARISDAQRLAALSQEAAAQFPQRRLLLAVEALRAVNPGDPRVPTAEQALRDALASSGGYDVARSEQEIEGIALDTGGRRLVTVDRSSARVWDLEHPAEPAAVLQVPSGFDQQVYFSRSQGGTPVQVSPKGRWLVLPGTGRLAVYDLDHTTSPPIVIGEAPTGSTGGDAKWTLRFRNARELVVVHGTRTVRSWDMENPLSPAVLLDRFDGDANNVSLSIDGRWFASRSEEGTVRVWDLEHPGGPRVLPRTEAGERGLVVSSDGRRVLTLGTLGGRSAAWIRDVDKPSLKPRVLTLKNAKASVITRFWDMSPDGRVLLSHGVPRRMELWDLAQDEPDPSDLSEQDGAEERILYSPTFSSDGRWLFTRSSRGADLRVRDVRDAGASPILLRGHEGDVNHVAISSEGRRAVAIYDHRIIRVWELDQAVASPVTFHRPGDMSSDMLFGRAYPWVKLAVSSDGNRIVTAELSRIYEWRRDKGAGPARTVDINWRDAERKIVSSDARRVVTVSLDRIVRVWDLDAPNPAPTVIQGIDGIGWLEISPDGRWLVSAGKGAPVRLADLDSKHRAVELPGDGSLGVRFDRRGRRLVVFGADSVVRIWDLLSSLSGPVTLRVPSDTALELSSTGRWLLAGSKDGMGWIYDLSRREAPPKSVKLVTESIRAMRFSPDDRRLVVAGAGSVLRMFDLDRPTSTPIDLRGSGSSLAQIMFSPDGRWLAAADFNHTAQLWDLAEPGADPTGLGPKPEIYVIAFAPDSRWLIAGCGDGHLRLWNLGVRELIDLAARTAGRNLSNDEWQRYFPLRPYRPTMVAAPVRVP